MAGVELYFEAKSELSVAYGCLFLDNLNFVTRCRKFGFFVPFPADSPEISPQCIIYEQMNGILGCTDL